MAKKALVPPGLPQKVLIKPLVRKIAPISAQKAQEQPVRALVLPPMVTSEVRDMILDKLPTVDDSDYLSWLREL